MEVTKKMLSLFEERFDRDGKNAVAMNAVTSDEWDVITLQQQSADAGNPSSFRDSDFDTIVNKLNAWNGNDDGIDKTSAYMDKDFTGLCFTNLVDYDMLYGHRNDVDGYAKALTHFDERLPELLAKLREDDILMITADHGCDPSTPSTDHSREYTPLLMYGAHITPGKNYGTRGSFADIAATILSYFDIKQKCAGEPLEL